MAQVQFNDEEFTLLKRQVAKLLDHRNKSTPRDVRRKQDEYKILKSLDSKLLAANTLLRLDRRDLRGAEGIAKLGLNLLQTAIIPGYQDRIAKESDAAQKAKLQGYADKSMEAFKIYTSILAIISKEL